MFYHVANFLKTIFFPKSSNIFVKLTIISPSVPVLADGGGLRAAGAGVPAAGQLPARPGALPLGLRQRALPPRHEVVLVCLHLQPRASPGAVDTILTLP